MLTKKSATKTVRKKAAKRVIPHHDEESVELPELMECYYPIVRSVVRNMMSSLPDYADEEELHSIGIRGLVSAVKKYDPKQKVTFEGYVALRVRGAILDELRKMDRLPRTARQKARKYQKVSEILEQELGRQPNDLEMRERLEMNPKQYRRMQDAIRPIVLVSLDKQYESDDDNSLYECLADENHESSPIRMERQEDVSQLAEIIQKLPERYKKILAMYYYENMKLCEIAEIFAVSEARICQIHTKAISMLKKMFVTE